MISDTDIRAILTAHGFELKEQPGLKKDLHPYVFRAVRAVLEFAMEASMQRIAQRLPPDCQPPRPGLAGLLYAISELARRRADAESGMDLLQIQLDELRNCCGSFIQVFSEEEDVREYALALGLLVQSEAGVARLNPLVFGGDL
jgi:hypothetical protein